MEDCPSNDYKEGEPQGKCWGNEHYMCRACAYYREDFKKYGQELIDYVYQIQGEVQITVL